jgi:putative ABC transport system permease protein
MKNFYLIFRNLKKNKTATTLGVAGLVVGIMCVVYIFLIVTDEIGYDRFHKNIDRIFVVHAYLENGADKSSFNGCPPAVSPALRADYPEVENSCRYIPPYFRYLITYSGNKYVERTAYADFSLFDIFTFPFIYGGPGESDAPNRVVLTEMTARRFFGDDNPVGKIVRIDNRLDMTVTGVIKNIPGNSSISFDAIIPVENIAYYYGRPDYLTSWYNNSYTTFGLLNDPGSFSKIATTITRRIQKEIPESINFLRAYRFRDTYLYEQKRIRNVRVYILIAFLVLCAAILNFINLNTARSAKQAKDTGLRKTFGATRFSVAKRIFSEVAVICLLAFIFALFLVYLGLPFINRTVGREISFHALFTPLPALALALVYLVTVFLAGSYPALFLSSFTPGQILNSNFQTIRSRGIIRNGMVVVMFIISGVLLASTMVISRQTSYLQNMDLGYEKENLMYIQLQGKMAGQVKSLKQELSRSGNITSACVVSHLPTLIGNSGEGWDWEGRDPGFKPLVLSWQTDEDLLGTFGSKMVEGDYLSADQNGIVINKTFADMIGWDSFQGRTITNGGQQYRILGVIKDIQCNSLTAATKPMAIEMVENQMANYMVMRISSGNTPGTIDYIRKVCESIEPDFPVEYTFFNEAINQKLASEINLRKLVTIFSGFSVVVLCLGLLGMVMFLTEQRTKEIGIRKCLGENTLTIAGQFIRPFIVSGIIAIAISAPLAWYIMAHWLQNYTYRVGLSPGPFALSGLIVICIAILTVIWHIWITAKRNPVEALRYE